MVYLAAGVSGLTAIVGTFFIKDYLNLSAAFLASLGFWAGLPWALKMPLGHLVDLILATESLPCWARRSHNWRKPFDHAWADWSHCLYGRNYAC